jgi:oligoendopeptidase F
LTRDRVPEAETWDLTGIFADQDALRDAMGSVDGLVSDVLAYRGRLGESADVLREALDAAYRARLVLERISVYARLSYDEDTTNGESQAILDEASALAIRASQQLAWFDPELLTVPEETLNTFMADEQLAPYRHVVDDVVRNRAHTRTPEIEELLAATGDISRTARDSFGALDNADLSYGQVRDEEGNLIELTKGRYHLLLESRNRPVRTGAYDVYMAAYERHKHVLSALHSGSVRKDVFYS